MSQPSNASHPIDDDSSSESSGFDDGISDNDGAAAVALIVEDNNIENDSAAMKRPNWIMRQRWARMSTSERAAKLADACKDDDDDDDEEVVVEEEEDSVTDTDDDDDPVEDMLLNVSHTKKDDKEEVDDEAEEEDIAALGEEKAKAKKKPQRGGGGGRSKRGAPTKKKKSDNNEIPQIGPRPAAMVIPDRLPEPTKKDHYKGSIKKNGTGEDIKVMANARISLLEMSLRQHVANGKLIHQTAVNGSSKVEEYMDQVEERMKYFEGRTESLNKEVAELRVLLAELKATNAGLEQQLTFTKELGKAQKTKFAKAEKKIATLESDKKKLTRQLNSVDNDEHKVEMVQKISDIKTNAAIKKQKANAAIKRQEKEEDKQRKNESFEQIMSAHNNPNYSRGDGTLNQRFFGGGGGGGRSWGGEYYDDDDYDWGADYNYNSYQSRSGIGMPPLRGRSPSRHRNNRRSRSYDQSTHNNEQMSMDNGGRPISSRRSKSRHNSGSVPKSRRVSSSGSGSAVITGEKQARRKKKRPSVARGQPKKDDDFVDEETSSPAKKKLSFGQSLDDDDDDDRSLGSEDSDTGSEDDDAPAFPEDVKLASSRSYPSPQLTFKEDDNHYIYASHHGHGKGHNKH